MSHQDTGRDSRFAYNHQALKRALEWLLAGASWAGVWFRTDCTWTPRFLVLTCLLWVWSDEKTLTGRFAAARKIARRMCPRREAPAGSYQAFTKRLRKWTATLVAVVQKLLRELMRQRPPERFRLAGFIPFGVDGSRFGLPRTASHEHAFAPSKKRKKTKSQKRRPQAQRKGQRNQPLTQAQQAARARGQKTAGPQLWVTVLWHLGCGLPWSWRLGPSDSSKREHLRQMPAELPLGALLVGDVPPSDPLARAAAPALARLYRATWARHTADCLAAARPLLGLGPGLTPAGDDCLVGWLSGAWAAGADGRRLVEAVRPGLLAAATHLTTRLSAAFLAAAVNGEAAEPLHGFVLAPTEARLAGLLELGATSGADLLAGYLLARAALASWRAEGWQCR